MDKVYLAIDLKSFYASVECVERGLDPLNTNLVVADLSRTEKTICLAVSPSMKNYGISGRARLFEVIQKVEQVNKQRLWKAPKHTFSGESCIDSELKRDPALRLGYITAAPQMARYMEISARIYGIYLKYIAPEDIFAYSIDEVFIDATGYLSTYNVSAHDFACMLIRDVLQTTGITATAGIGTNLFLCKVAMDIVAKHIPADKDGVRIAELNEETFKEKLWGHKPITDFWRVGSGTAKKLEKLHIYTMGDAAMASLNLYEMRKLHKIFGKNLELLIDHAWGIEPTTIADVKAYKPESNSISSGQVLQCPTNYRQTRLIVWEMADMLSLDLVDKGVVTNQLVLTVGYDTESMENYHGETKTDRYGKTVPKHAHGTHNLDGHTSSTKKIVDAAMSLFDKIIDRSLLSRRITLAACNVIREDEIPENYVQLDLFSDPAEEEQENKQTQKERALQEAMLKIKHKYGKNAVLKGTNYTEGATAKDRNKQIGGHKA